MVFASEPSKAIQRTFLEKNSVNNGCERPDRILDPPYSTAPVSQLAPVYFIARAETGL